MEKQLTPFDFKAPQPANALYPQNCNLSEAKYLQAGLVDHGLSAELFVLAHTTDGGAFAVNANPDNDTSTAAFVAADKVIALGDAFGVEVMDFQIKGDLDFHNAKLVQKRIMDYGWVAGLAMLKAEW